MKLYKIAFTMPFFTLMGCDKGPSFADLCEQHTEICQEFQQDTWCKRERIAVGFANLDHKLTASDNNKYRQLIAYEDYAQCMEHAAKIEHIKLKVKKTMRVNNVIKAQDRIKEISIATKNSEHPDLLYFHWSRYTNEHALNKFIALEGNELLEKPHLQVNLASYYIKRDPNKTLTLLYHALELYPSNAAIDTEIFKSIASVFADKREHKQAYIWSKILHLYDPEDKNISDSSLTSYLKTHNLNGQFLDRVAKTTLKHIHEGKFKSPQA